MPNYETVPSPAYSTPDYAAFGSTLGNLFNNQRKAQQDKIALQEQQMRLDQENAIKGVPAILPNGQPNWGGQLRALAGAGDTNAISRLGPSVQDQSFQNQATAAPSPFAGAGYPPQPKPPVGDLPPASAADAAPTQRGRSSGGYTPPAAATSAPNSRVTLDQAQRFQTLAQQRGDRSEPKSQLSAGTFGNLGGVAAPASDDLDTIVNRGLPADFDYEKRSKIEANLARIFKLGAGQKLTPEQSERVQAAVTGYAKRNGLKATSQAEMSGDYPDTQQGHAAFIRDRAQALGLDPSLPEGIAAAEGLRALSPKNPNSASVVDRNPDGTPFSFGDFQLNVRNGLGTEARRAGIDPADPKQWKQADEYALETMAKGGLAPWKGDAAVSAYQARGGGQTAPRLGNAPAARAIADATQPGAGGPQAAGGASQGRTVFPQIPLPKGVTDPQQAILWLDQEIARTESNPNPYIQRRAAALEDWRTRIAADYAPREVRQGQSFVDAQGNTVYHSPSAAETKAGDVKSRAADIASAIESGDQPPTLSGLYGVSPAVRQQLSKDGFDLSKHQLEWQGAQKQVASLNGPQQVRFVGLANSVTNTIDEVKELADQMQLSGVPLLNKAELAAYVQTQGNSPNGMLATNYLTAVNTLKEEFANLANGGYAPTEPAWKLADQQINADYGVKQLNSSLGEVQRLIKYRLNAMPGMSAVGPGAANPYMPGSGQGGSPTDGTGSQSSGRPLPSDASGSPVPAGRYRYDPSTGKLEPIK